MPSSEGSVSRGLRYGGPRAARSGRRSRAVSRRSRRGASPAAERCRCWSRWSGGRSAGGSIGGFFQPRGDEEGRGERERAGEDERRREAEERRGDADERRPEYDAAAGGRRPEADERRLAGRGDGVADHGDGADLHRRELRGDRDEPPGHPGPDRGRGGERGAGEDERVDGAQGDPGADSAPRSPRSASSSSPCSSRWSRWRACATLRRSRSRGWPEWSSGSERTSGSGGRTGSCRRSDDRDGRVGRSPPRGPTVTAAVASRGSGSRRRVRGAEGPSRLRTGESLRSPRQSPRPNR